MALGEAAPEYSWICRAIVFMGFIARNLKALVFMRLVARVETIKKTHGYILHASQVPHSDCPCSRANTDELFAAP
eukprot:3878886-Amphidinium_carterae.1